MWLTSDASLHSPVAGAAPACVSVLRAARRCSWSAPRLPQPSLSPSWLVSPKRNHVLTHQQILWENVKTTIQNNADCAQRGCKVTYLLLQYGNSVLCIGQFLLCCHKIFAILVVKPEQIGQKWIGKFAQRQNKTCECWPPHLQAGKQTQIYM